MFTDYRRYGFWDYEPLKNRLSQMIDYLNGKFDNIDVKVDVDTGAIADAVNETVKETLDSGLDENQKLMDEKFKLISMQIEKAKHEIIETPRPCPEHPCPKFPPMPPIPHHHPHHHHHPEPMPMPKPCCENKPRYYTDLNMDVLTEMNLN